MKLFHQAETIQLYRQILAQNRAALLSGGTGDPFLTAPPSEDTRRSLTLVIRPDRETAAKIVSYIQQIRASEPSLYLYPAEDLHITVMDILGGIPGRELPDELEAYIRCIGQSAGQIPPFDICLEGMTASAAAAMVCGYYETELERLRVQLREQLKSRQLPLEERYKTTSCHLTAARVTDRLHHPDRFLEWVESAGGFGEFRAETLELVWHDWYDARKQILACFPLNP